MSFKSIILYFTLVSVSATGMITYYYSHVESYSVDKCLMPNIDWGKQEQTAIRMSEHDFLSQLEIAISKDKNKWSIPFFSTEITPHVKGLFKKMEHANIEFSQEFIEEYKACLLYTSPSPRDS